MHVAIAYASLKFFLKIMEDTFNLCIAIHYYRLNGNGKKNLNSKQTIVEACVGVRV